MIVDDGNYDDNDNVEMIRVTYKDELGTPPLNRSAPDASEETKQPGCANTLSPADKKKSRKLIDYYTMA